ncbi:mis18-binding protein 1 isoform X2 [Erythrolamprus reginae]|uniref:mis18-binding protein 1 isoform X2 n=1 Tax=Erythrolamprus reginae TaxID=121349 RepID=UPI00396CEB38
MKKEGERRKEIMSLKAVSLHNIPDGTPLKDFVKFQMNCTLDSAKIPSSVVFTCQNICSSQEQEHGIHIFQSTLMSHNLHTQEFFDISEIKASSEGIQGMISSSQKNKPLTRSAVQKRKACEPLCLDSPTKIFLRMKQRAALLKEKNKPSEAKLLDPNCTKDSILIPEMEPSFLQKSEKIPIVKDKQKTKLNEDFPEESNVKTVSVADFTAVNKNLYTTVISPPYLESPNKFFSRAKQRLQKDWLQKAKQPLITSCPTKKCNNFNKERVSATVSQKEIIVEPGELANNTFTIISNPVIVSDDHIKSREFLKERAYGKLQEEAGMTPSKYIYGQKAEENLSVLPQKPSQHLYDTIFATPKAYIPRKQQPATKTLLDEPDTGTNEKFSKEKEMISITKWVIRVINDNTAVGLEGLRKDIGDVFWHSNVIVERIASNQVKTLKGSIYMLQGCIDAVSMKKEGIPPTFIKKFQRGIPRNWKMLVDDLLLYMKRKEERAFSVSDGEKTNKYSKELDLPQNIKRKREMKNITYDALPLQNDKIPGMQMKTIDLLNDSEKSFTRSGRCVKPPMLYWCGERMHRDHELNVTINKGGANYLSPAINSTHPATKFQKKNDENPFKNHKEVTFNQAKGKTEMKSENITRKTKCNLKQQSQNLISDTEENDFELIIEDIHKKRATVMLSPLKKITMQEKQHSNRRPRNEQNVTKDYGSIACYERNVAGVELDTSNCPLNSLKQHQQIEKVVESVLCTSEDESSEDIPCIKRKTLPSFRRQTFNKERNNTQDPSREQKSTENFVAPSQSRKTKYPYFVQEDTLEELSNKSSPLDLSTSSELASRNRQKSQKFKRARKNVIASDSESENNIEEFPVKENKITIPTKITNGHISTNPKAFPMTQKPYNRSKLKKVVEAHSDTNESWTEEELQMLYRAVASFPPQKSGFWMDVAKTVRTRSAEECQEKYLAEQKGKKRDPRKTSKPRKKEELDKQPLGRVGTLKRRKQMRMFLEQMPKDNRDDIFASTPRDTKAVAVCTTPISRRTNVLSFKDAGVKNLFEVEQKIPSDEEEDTYFST